MTTDLEVEIRDALYTRAQSVTTAALRYADAPRREQRSSPRAAWSVIAIAAVVAALTIVVAIRPWRDDHSATTAGSSGVPASNTTWRLVRADSPDGSIVAGNDLRAKLSFTGDRHLLGDDGINTTDSTYVPTAKGFRTYPIGTSLVGYAGNDRRVLEVISAMGALFNNALTGSVDVESHLRGDHLTLQANGYILQFRRAS